MKMHFWPEGRTNAFKLYAEMLVTSIPYLGWSYVFFETVVALIWLGVINLCVVLDSRVDAPFWGWEALVCLLFAHLTIAAIFYEAAREEGSAL